MGRSVKSRGALALVLALAAGASACRGDPPAGPLTGAGSAAARILAGQALEKKSADVAELRGVTLDRFEHDHLRHRATVARARLDRVRGEASGEGIRVELDASDPSAPGAAAVATADRAESVLASKRVLLQGHVRVRDREGRVLGADAITYDFATDVAEAPGHVTLDGKNFHAEGTSLTVERATGRAEIGGPAAGTIRPRRR